MKTKIKLIIQGLGCLEGYGSHPGIPIYIAMLIMGTLAGVLNENLPILTGGLFGFLVMVVFFTPVLLIGAYDRAKEYNSKEINQK